MINKIEHMLKMQDEMNTVVHPDWKNQNFDWCRAAWIECAELMEHIGWKWWKKQTTDVEQAKLELVDIWHFILSLCIQRGVGAEEVASIIAIKNPFTVPSTGNVLTSVEELVGSILNDNMLHSIQSFISCCEMIGLSFDDLYKLYVGKNVLNKFRQANGYKEGTYIKTWFDDQEDNAYLYEVLKTVDADHDEFDAIVEDLLQIAYDSIKHIKVEHYPV